MTTKPTNITSKDSRSLSSVIVPKSGNKDVEREHQNRINKHFDDRIEELEVSGGGTTVVGGGDGNHSTLTADPTNFVLTDSGDRNYHIDIKTGGVGSNELASTAVTAGDYGDDDQSPTFTVDEDGRITAAADVHIPITVYKTAGENLSAGEFVNIDSSDEVILADASSIDTAAVGYVKSAFSSSAMAKVYLNKGELTGLSGLSAGKKYFLSAATPGAIVAQPDLSGTKIAQFLGTANSTTSLIVDIDEAYRLWSSLSLASNLDDMQVGTAFSDTLAITGGVPTYSVTASTLPAGISAVVSGSNVNVTGTPTTEDADFDWSITVEDGEGATATASGTVEVAAAAVGLAPDEIANLTVWLDFTDGDTLFSDSGGTTPSALGDDIYRVTNKADSVKWTSQESVPQWTENLLGSLPGVYLDATNDWRFREVGTDGNAENFFSASAGTLSFLMRVSGITNTSTNYAGVVAGFEVGSASYGTIYSDSNDAFNLLDNSGFAGTSAAATQGDWHVVQVRHNGSARQIRVDNGSWQSGGSGTVSSLNYQLTVGLWTQFSANEGRLAMCHAVAYNAALSDSDADDLRDWMLALIP